MPDKLYRALNDAVKMLVDRGDGTHAERVEAYPPKVLMTDDDGDYARIRVDVGQTGFFAGREARSFYEFTIPTGQTHVIKAVAPVDVILYGFSVYLTLAELRVSIISGGTEGGSFSTALPVIKTNNTSDASSYMPQTTMSVGGTITGGTEQDVVLAVSGSPAALAVAESATDNSPIGFQAGTYYIKLENTDGADAKGIIKFRWEERT